MSELFLRRVVLELILPQATGIALSLEEIRIRFIIGKTIKKDLNTARVEVFNLSENTRALFETKGASIRLSAGYLGIPETSPLDSLKKKVPIDTIFVGNITKLSHEMQGPDIITLLESGDGDNALRNAKIEKGYPPGTNFQQIVIDLSNQLGIAKGARAGLPSGKKYANGVALSGLVRDQLDAVLKGQNLDWSIQDGALQILGKNSTTTDPVFIVTRETGMVGSPSKTKEGIEFTTLMNGVLRPGRRVKLQSKFVDGVFRLQKVSHVGDSFSGEFLTRSEAKRLAA